MGNNDQNDWENWAIWIRESIANLTNHLSKMSDIMNDADKKLDLIDYRLSEAEKKITSVVTSIEEDEEAAAKNRFIIYGAIISGAIAVINTIISVFF